MGKEKKKKKPHPRPLSEMERGVNSTVCKGWEKDLLRKSRVV